MEIGQFLILLLVFVQYHWYLLQKCNSLQKTNQLKNIMPQRYNKWSLNQDQCLKEIIAQEGTENWARISLKLKNQFQIKKRTSKQCKERWQNHLNQNINNSKWTQDQDQKLLYRHSQHGNRWRQIAVHFDGRTDNHVKNRFYAIIKKSIRAMCKAIKVKTTQANVYLIKPNVLSELFLKAGSLETKTSQHGASDWFNSSILSDRQCSEITQIIKTFIFDSNKKVLIEKDTEKIRWAIQKIQELSLYYRNEVDSNNDLYRQSSSQSSLILKRKSLKRKGSLTKQICSQQTIEKNESNMQKNHQEIFQQNFIIQLNRSESTKKNDLHLKQDVMSNNKQEQNKPYQQILKQYQSNDYSIRLDEGEEFLEMESMCCYFRTPLLQELNELRRISTSRYTQNNKSTLQEFLGDDKNLSKSQTYNNF